MAEMHTFVKFAHLLNIPPYSRLWYSQTTCSESDNFKF